MQKFLSAIVLLALAPWLQAQEYRAKVQGVVTDTSQAVVPGAQVVLLNTQTGVSVTRGTNATGQYLFDLVEPGTYSLVCERTGFNRFVQEKFTVQVRGDVTVNITLKVGQVNDTVTVTMTPVEVQFNSSSMELMVDRAMLEELPNIGRNPFSLATLDPGVTQRGSFPPDRRFPFYMFVSGLMDVGGSTQGKNELLLDGAPIMVGNRGSYSPPMDAVQEFTVQQNSVDAQYGRSAGGVMNVAIKSGTNQYHGTAYYFGRNPVLNARANAIANTLNQTRNSIMGGTVGGPIKKNKFFNFLAFEDWRTAEFEQQINKTQATALQKTGDFSKSLNKAGQLLPIYDPWTTVLLNATTATRTPFPGSVIPASRIDLTARRVMQDVPLPNNPGDDIMGTNNFKYGRYVHHRYWNFTDRMDWNPGNKWKVYGRFSRFQETTTPNYYGDTPGLGWDGGIMNSQNITSDAVYTINPNTFLNLRWSATWIWDDLKDTNSEIAAQDLASFWPNNPWYQSYLKDVPHIFYPDFGVLGRASGSAYWERGTTNNATAYLAQQHGKHYLKFGAEFSRFAEYNYNPAGMSFTTDAGLTANTYLSPDTSMSGNKFATFLLGALSTGSMAYTAPQDMRSYYHGVFIQDDYKIARKLTLNLGLRWEYETPPAEVNNIYTRYLDLTNPIPEMQATPPQIPAVVKNYANINYRWNGALVFANNSHPGLWNNSKHNFMPRIGAAYAINSRTALRFGFARYINPPMDVIAGPQQMLLGPAYGYSVTSTALTPLTGVPQTTLSNPFPSSNPLLPIPGQSLGRYTQLGGAVTWNDQDMRTGVNDRYHLSLQRQLPGNIVADGTFFMIQSHNLPYAKNMNMADPNLAYTYKAALNQTVANPFYNYLTPSLFPGPLRNQPAVAISSLLLPYPQYGALSQSNTPGFFSHTYSAQVRVRRSFSHGFGFTASYNSPLTRNTAFFDTFDTYINRLTFRDVANPRHGVNVSGTYELPLGKGRQFLSGAPRVVDLLIGGWSASPIFSYNSGTPIQFTNALQVVKPGSPKLDNPTPQQWFDTSFFKTPVANTPRANPYFYPGLTGPRNWNIDSTLSKYFRIRERYRVELRMEAYNLLNKIMRGAPPIGINNALFGKVTTQSNKGREFQYTLRIHF
jgi:hypothetical protein